MDKVIPKLSFYLDGVPYSLNISLNENPNYPEKFIARISNASVMEDDIDELIDAIDMYLVRHHNLDNPGLTVDQMCWLRKVVSEYTWTPLERIDPSCVGVAIPK